MEKDKIKLGLLIITLGVLGTLSYYTYETTRTLTPEELRTRLIDEANSGDPQAEFRLGVNYFKGWGGFTLNYEKSFEYFKKSADHGNPKAAFNVGVAYLNGEGVSPDTDNAIKYLTKVTELDKSSELAGNAYFVMSGIYYANRNDKSPYYNPKLAIDYMLKAKELNYHLANYTLGLYYIDGSIVEKNIDKGIQYLKEALNSEKKNVSYMNSIADAYLEIKNYSDAALYYKMAIENGSNNSSYQFLFSMIKDNKKDDGINFIKTMSTKNASSGTLLSHLYMTDEIQGGDSKDILTLLDNGIKNKIPEAAYLYGIIYLQGKYGLHGNKEAKKFLELGLNINSVTYQPDGLLLAEIYLDGKSSPKDIKSAIWTLKELSRDGSIDATNKLIEIYNSDKYGLKNKESVENYESRLSKINDENNLNSEIIKTIFKDSTLFNYNNYSYAQAIRSKVRANVVLPQGIKGNPQTVIMVNQEKDGTVTKTTLLKSSGNSDLDNAVILAINKSSPLPTYKNTDDTPNEIEITYIPFEDYKKKEQDDFLKELKIEEEKLKLQKEAKTNKNYNW